MVIYSRKGLFPAISINKDVTVISNCSPPNVCIHTHTFFLVAQTTWNRSLVQEDPLENGMATHSNILARRIPSTEEPGGL